MSTQTQILLELWIEARSRFTNQLSALTAEDLRRRLVASPNSIGFLIRHIGEVELLFAKNVFGAHDVRVAAKTVIAKRDTGEWTSLEELQEYVAYSFETLKAIIEQQADQDWATTITTQEFGTKTKAEAFGRIVSHTAYHAGQMALIYKYATP